ncbi:MAG: sterol desaturase family protein [Rhodospirillaceae bacterium]|jgi:sterol desaturase/sphingolipid hydroxylase (fatty acid hydroxylase superfamily)
MALKIGFWSDREYHLDRMNLGDLAAAYFQYYAIAAYFALAAVTGAYATWAWMNGLATLTGIAGAVVATILIYPLVWYVLHRWILHSKWMWKSKLTAPVWKRIHYDHHSDPNNLKVLFGALYTTLPTVALATVPFGFALAGWPGAAAALCAGVLQTCFYEFIHCIQHLGYVPQWGWVKRMKKLHMAHHFHNETGNFGITNYLWDRVLGTMYEQIKLRPRSETVFNLGYDEEVAKDYPYVAELTPNWPHTANPVHRQREYAQESDDGELAPSS